MLWATTRRTAFFIDAIPLFLLSIFCTPRVLLPQEALPVQGLASTLQPIILPSKSYFEVYTLTAQHDDGTFIQAQLTVTNLGLRNQNAACKILVLKPGEKAWKGNQQFSRTNWSYAALPNPVLSVGPCHLAATPAKTFLSGTLEGASVSITLDQAPASVKLPNTDYAARLAGNSAKEGNRKVYEFDMLIPWAKVQTTLSLPGGPTRKLQGYGSLERTRSTTFPSDISRGWVIFRGYREGHHFLANLCLPPKKGSAAIGWIWKQDEQKPRATTGLEIITASETAAGKKEGILLLSPPDQSFTIATTSKLYRYVVIDELGPLGYFVKLIVGNPIVSYYDAAVRIPGEKEPIAGVLELTNIE